MSDPELALLLQLSKVDHEVFHSSPGFGETFDVLRKLEKANWVTLETWPPTKDKRPCRRYTAVAAAITESGRDALRLVGRPRGK